MSQRVVVTGDVVHDHNFIRLPVPPASYFESLASTVAQISSGGAWYLTRQVELACADLIALGSHLVEGPELHDYEKSAPLRSDAHAYSVWAPFAQGPREGLHPAGPESKRVWRIEQFLGCERARKLTPPRPTSATRGAPRVLVVDDANLGFRSNRNLWPRSLRAEAQSKSDSPDEIVLKTVSPLGGGSGNPLWTTLLRNHADQLTVVTSVRTLRARGAAISLGLSWDSTLVDLHNELMTGTSAGDLGMIRRLVVNFPREGIAIYERLNGHLEFERLVYHPEDLEGSWDARHSGTVYGDLSIVTAAIVRHLVERHTYPLFIAAARAIAAMRTNHLLGAGSVVEAGLEETLKTFDIRAGNQEVRRVLLPDHKPVDKPLKKDKLPEVAYFAAVPSRLVTGQDDPDPLAGQHSLLENMIGPGYHWLTEKGMRVVLYGVDATLAAAPKAKYRNFVTVDREEIERTNEIRRLVTDYVRAPANSKPLSIAAFGPPGSGKSFAIKELSASLFGDSQESIDFNLSQVSGSDELTRSFHRVREATVKGKIPLVFWDEFDTENLKWLKDFLAPMQDGKFLDGGVEYSLGKVIFVFAGGTAKAFAYFGNRSSDPRDVTSFSDKKGPDFISRLSGYVNVKGPNPIDLAPERYSRRRSNGTDGSAPRSRRSRPTSELVRELRESSDQAHVMRRAVLLRAALERFQPHLIPPGAAPAAISRDVVRAFLWAREFKHGARSLEAIVRTSAVANSRYFALSSLPSRDLLRLHVSDDFVQLESAYELPELELDRFIDSLLAMPGHSPFSQITSEEERQDWRIRVEATLGSLHLHGYGVRPASARTSPGGVSIDDRGRDECIRGAHQIWLRERLAFGYSSGSSRLDRLRIQPDMVPFDRLPAATRLIYDNLLDRIVSTLGTSDYVLVSSGAPS